MKERISPLSSSSWLATSTIYKCSLNGSNETVGEEIQDSVWFLFFVHVGVVHTE